MKFCTRVFRNRTVLPLLPRFRSLGAAVSVTARSNCRARLRPHSIVERGCNGAFTAWRGCDDLVTATLGCKGVEAWVQRTRYCLASIGPVLYCLAWVRRFRVTALRWVQRLGPGRYCHAWVRRLRHCLAWVQRVLWRWVQRPRHCLRMRRCPSLPSGCDGGRYCRAPGPHSRATWRYLGVLLLVRHCSTRGVHPLGTPVSRCVVRPVTANTRNVM